VNPLQGESPLRLGGRTYTLVYDWRALAVMARAVGSRPNLFDPDVLAASLLAGLERHHGTVTKEDIFDANPAMGAVVSDFHKALQLAYFGHRVMPQDGGGGPRQEPEDHLEQIAKAYGTAFRVGIRPSEFWTLTPFQTDVIVEAHTETLRDDFETLLSVAWHNAVFQRAKTLPPLKNLFRREHDPARITDTDDPDQIAAKQMIAALRGATQAKSIAVRQDNTPTPDYSAGTL
jgi:hypothetical protein